MKFSWIVAIICLGALPQAHSFDFTCANDDCRQILSDLTGLQGDSKIGRPGAHLTASGSGGQATIAFEYDSNRNDQSILHFNHLSKNDRKNSYVLVVAISTPTSNGNDITKLATLDGLADATNIEAKLSTASSTSTVIGNPYFSGSLRFGYKDSNYYESTSLVKKSFATKPWSSSITLGTSNKEGGKSASLSWGVQMTQNDNPSSIHCPAPTGTAFTCVNGPIGAPVRAITHLTSLEVRFPFEKFVATPSLNYAITGGVHTTGVDIPVYLIKDEENKFTSGIDIGLQWTHPSRQKSV